MSSRTERETRDLDFDNQRGTLDISYGFSKGTGICNYAFYIKSQKVLLSPRSSSDGAISSSSSTPSPTASRGSSPSITKIEELPDDQAVLKCPSPASPSSATQSRSLSQDSIEDVAAAAAEIIPKEESTPESEMAAAESR